MSDYKDLLKSLRCCGDAWPYNRHCDECPCEYLSEECAHLEITAANIIEQLVKERDAAIADIEKYCRYCIVCKNADFTNDYTHNRCHKCLDEDSRYFEWRGVQNETN